MIAPKSITLAKMTASYVLRGIAEGLDASADCAREYNESKQALFLRKQANGVLSFVSKELLNDTTQS